MVQINYDFYEDLTAESLNRILDELAAGRVPKPGPQIDRQLSAPVGGPTTLTDPSLYTGQRRRGAAAQTPLQDEPTQSGRARPPTCARPPFRKPPIGDKSRDDKTTRRE